MSAAPRHEPAKPVAAPAGPVAQSAAATAVGGRRTTVAARPNIADLDTSRALVISVMRRIEGYLEEENMALDKTSKFDFKASNDRKSQGLVDLNQALRRLSKSDVGPDLQKRLGVFRGKLEVNLKKIQLHLEAVKEIAAILSDAIQNADSDGTYTRNIGPYRGAP